MLSAGSLSNTAFFILAAEYADLSQKDWYLQES